MSTAMSGRQAYPHPHVRTDWLAKVQEDIIDPALPIVDPHHHLWHDRPSGRYMIEQLAGDLGSGHNIVATVFMQCAWNHRAGGPEYFRPIGETEAVAATAVLSETGAYGRSRACAGIVGFADLRNPELDAVLDAHVAAGGGRFRGIRHIVAWDDSIIPTTSVVPPPGLLHDPDFLGGVRRLGQRGFSFDAWLYHPQLKDLLAVARAAEGTPIVIDHVGGPLGGGPFRGRRDDVFKGWADDMKALAACPNVHVKLGGLAMPVNGFDYDKHTLPPSSETMAKDWAPWFETCIALFGPARCMFESNFPVDKGMCSYPVLWNAFKRIAAGASAAEKAALFHDTAARFYGLQALASG
jgi:predicted TIM-barrel fold metal-dependent hydrolase